MKIAITGGIGSGKSSVMRALEAILSEYRFFNVDDEVNDLYDHPNIVKVFSPLGITTKAQMSDVVFNNPFLKKRLEELSEPIIKASIDSWLKLPNIVIEFPLLLNYPDYIGKFDVIVCVSADEETRLSRVMNRNGFSKEKVRLIINAQKPQNEIENIADLIFDNSMSSESIDYFGARIKGLVDNIQLVYKEKKSREPKKSSPVEVLSKIASRNQKQKNIAIGIVSGSFDPITNGHLWVIDKALDMVDIVHVVIATNASKTPLFSDQEKIKMINLSILSSLGLDKKARTRVTVLPKDELLISYAQEHGAKHIFRGIRSEIDFNFEYQINLAQRKIDPTIEMVYLMPPREITEISSSLVRSLYRIKGTDMIVESYVPSAVFDALKKKLNES